jgi:hypothetical protein
MIYDEDFKRLHRAFIRCQRRLLNLIETRARRRLDEMPRGGPFQKKRLAWRDARRAHQGTEEEGERTAREGRAWDRERAPARADPLQHRRHDSGLGERTAEARARSHKAPENHRRGGTHRHDRLAIRNTIAIGAESPAQRYSIDDVLKVIADLPA